MKVVITIKNIHGEFKSLPFDIPNDDYPHLQNLCRNFHTTTYDIETEEGFIVIPPNILNESILTLKILDNNVAN